MSHRNLWRMQLQPNVSGAEAKKHTNQCLENNSIGLDFAIADTMGDLRNTTKSKVKQATKPKGNGKDQGIYYDFYDKMAIGDVVLITIGPKPIALVEVVGEYQYSSESDLWCQHHRKIRILGYYETDQKMLPKQLLGLGGTIQRIKRSPTAPVYKFICAWLAWVY